MVTNGNAFAIPTEAQRAAYRGFMYDLHARLAAHAAVREGPPIEFKAGFKARLYFWLMVRVVFWVLVFVGAPLAAFLMTGETKPFLLLVAAGCSRRASGGWCTATPRAPMIRRNYRGNWWSNLI